MRFVNRQQELQEIRALLHSPKFEFLVVYGRRRVGKTELIKNALRGKKSHYFLCSEGNNLAHFQQEFQLTDLKPDWEVVLKALREEIIVFDEFPYLVSEDKTILSTFQRVIDTSFQTSKTKLILLGSSIGMMEEFTLAYKSPLYGRKTGQLKVRPLNFMHLHEFFPQKHLAELVEIFSFADGVPYYLQFIEGEFWDWLDKELQRKTSFLKDELRFLLKTEFKEIRTYQYLLEAIAQGKNTFKEIKDYLSFTGSDLTPYLLNLERLEFIERVSPLIGKSKKISLYQIRDNFITFWHRFIAPESSSLELGTLRSTAIKKHYTEYLGYVFERVVREALLYDLQNRRKVIPFPFTKIGKQWGKIPGAKSGENTYEIDVCATNPETGDVLFGECKWKENVDARSLLINLKRKAEYVPWKGGNKFYLIAAKSVIEPVIEENVIIFTLKEFEKILKKK